MTQSVDDYFDAANACELDGRWEEANDNYERALELQPDYVEAYDNRAGNWVELHEYARAISDYHRVAEYWPDYPQVHNNLALIYLDADDEDYNNPKLALAHAKQACRLTNNNSHEFLSTYARAFHACRSYKQAVYYQQLAVSVALRVRSDSNERVDQINAESSLPGLKQTLEQFRADEREHCGNKTSLLGRLLSLLRRRADNADRKQLKD